MRPIIFSHITLKTTRYYPIVVSLLGQRQFSTARVSSLENFYQSQIPTHLRYCLAQLEKEWTYRQPLKNKKVLLNMHLTGITLAVIDLLFKASASVDVTVSPDLVRHDSAQRALNAAGIPVLTDIPDAKKMGYYDIIYDCGAGMRQWVPTMGMVELTQTHSTLYRNLNFPVITVDNSLTKSIETGLGTGDSLVRLIHQLARQSLTTLVKQTALPSTHPDFMHFPLLVGMLNARQLFSQHRFMIFGYGKVGKGIVNALESAGTPKSHLFIVEAFLEAYLQAMKAGYQGIWLKEVDSQESVQTIRSLLPQIWAVITATGQAGALSRYFSQSDYESVPLLINMGTLDEFGVHFSPQRVLNGKKPANFMLERPTEIIYLDPIFSLFLQGGEELFTNPDLAKGLNNISSQRDQAVLNEWLTRHGEDIWRHRLDQQETEQLIQNLCRHSIFLHKEKTAPVTTLSHTPALSR